MKRLKPFIFLAFFLVILISLISCVPVASTPAVSTPVEISLPENNRIKGAAWLVDNILAYFTEDGVHIWNAESGESPVLKVSSSFNTDKSISFALSPDKSMVCVFIEDVRGHDICGVYEVQTGKVLLNVDLPSDFAQRYEIYNLRYGMGFLDDNTLYIYSRFEIWFVDISTGVQRRITADASPFYESCDKEQQVYFEWVYMPV